MSLFQGDFVEIDNPQSREEDEELEEQRRRQEELTDLLSAGIHAFNYDESTINSSATSVEGEYTERPQREFALENENKSVMNKSSDLSQVLEQNYRDANQQDQLKILYEVRGREIKKLIDEFNTYKEEKQKEIHILKNKNTLSEAEIRHLQISLSNAENLLVEKTETINSLQHNANLKEEEIDKLKKDNEELKLEICAYNSTVNELQLKLSNTNPFSTEARRYNSDEIQKVHQDQISKLESQLQEQCMKTQILEKRNSQLEEEVKKLATSRNKIEEENNLTIMGLSKKLQSSQQQCRDLYLLGEAIKKESDHFKGRVKQLENSTLNLSGDDIKIKKMDKESLIVNLEKLKRMLLDKNTELNTLKVKLKFYNADMDELFEYRKLLNKMYSYEVKLCSNLEHEELLIFMQGQLQSYQQAVEDRNNQIVSLNVVNKELQEKIEDMIRQTRTDIQNIAQKYSLPQLETMNNELKNAEETINNLQKQLLEKNNILKTMQEELEETQKHHKTAVDEKDKLQTMLMEIKLNLDKTTDERNNFKTLYQEMKESQVKLINENSELKLGLQKRNFKLDSSESIEMIDSESMEKIHSLKLLNGEITLILELKNEIRDYLKLLESQELVKIEVEKKLNQWSGFLKKIIASAKNNSLNVSNSKEIQCKDDIQELTNVKTLLEGEKCTLEYQLKISINELENAKTELRNLIEDKKTLMEEVESNTHTISQLNDQLSHLKKCLEIVEENKIEIEKQLENAQKQLDEGKQESIDLHKEVSGLNEDVVRKHLFKKLKDIENRLEQDRSENDISGSNIFKKCLQAEILKVELLLRERIEEESIKKMQNIEQQYKNVLAQRTETYSKDRDKWKNQEAKYRKQFVSVLEECGRKIEELEKENMDLMKQTDKLFKEYKMFRANAVEDIEKYKKLIVNYQTKIEVVNKNWSDLFDFYSRNFSNIQKQNQNKMKNLQRSIKMSETEIQLIENIYNEKMKKLELEWKTKMNKI